jgi:hypothetical protein
MKAGQHIANGHGGAGPMAWVPLPAVSENFDAQVVAVSVLFFTLFYFFGRILLPLSASYRSWSRDDQYHARSIVPSMAFISIIFPLSLYAMITDIELRKNKVVGSTELSRLIIEMATGYFIYDTGIVMTHLKQDGIELAAHGVLCFFTYGFAAVYEYYHYYGPVFLMFEFTTIFVNGRW